MYTAMELIIGGRNQGKLQYAMQQCGVMENEVQEDCDGNLRVLNHLQRLVHEMLCVERMTEKDIAARVFDYVERVPGCIVICDEIGGGLVPMEAE